MKEKMKFSAVLKILKKGTGTSHTLQIDIFLKWIFFFSLLPQLVPDFIPIPIIITELLTFHFNENISSTVVMSKIGSPIAMYWILV